MASKKAEPSRLFKALENLLYILSILLCEWVKMELVVPDWIVYVINVLLALAGFLAYRYLHQARLSLRKIAEFIIALEKALEDNRITNEEINELVEKIKQVVLPEGEE